MTANDWVSLTPALAGLLLILNAAWHISPDSKTKRVIDIVIGVICLAGVTYTIIDNSKTTQTIISNTDTTRINVDSILLLRRVDSIEDAKFKRYLRDTFGIEKRGDSAVKVANTDRYPAKPEQAPVQMPNTGLNVSENYGVRFSKYRDSLFLYPQEGVWVRPFISWDSTMYEIGMGNFYGEGLMDTRPKKLVIRGTKYSILTYFSTHARSKDKPLYLDTKTIKPTIFFFGDDIDSQKRYLYDKGTVYWIPNIVVTNEQ